VTEIAMDIHQLSEFAANHIVLVSAFFVVLAMLVGTELRHRFGKVRDIPPAEATRLINHENAVLVDMRNDKDYRDGHIVNAVHVPADKKEASDKLEKYRDRPLIVCCRSGNQSLRLCTELSKKGFASVYNLKGGLHAWQQAGLPLSKGR
jgi:rhodanese-related sulfurtransferase